VGILIIEDEQRIAEFVARGLREHGYAVDTADDGRSGLEAALVEDVDLVVLDLNLPLLPGEQVLRRLRAVRPRLPVIVLSAKDGVDDRVDNLDAGADDYLVKPFSFAELLARVQARLRDRPRAPLPDLQHGRVRLDVHRRVASIDGRESELTAREFALLETFLRHPDQTLSHLQLLANAWGDDERPNSNVVEVYIRHLRVKLVPDTIETIRGTGYRFVG
jgi:DNA-binding response OmpR family regulator